MKGILLTKEEKRSKAETHRFAELTFEESLEWMFCSLLR